MLSFFTLDASLVSLLLLALSSLSLACIPCPVFTESSYTGSILENATIGAIVLTVTASNAYGDPITYSGLSYPFSIDASTGIIKLIGSLDSVSSPYAGTVVANVMGFTQSVSVAVNIIQLPDYPVTCSPSNLPLLVEENLDPPFNTTEFLNCTSDSTEPFALVSDSSLVSFDPLGYIIIEEKLNYENKSVFDLLVSFTDSTMSALPGNASISLRVIPVNEYPPTFVNDTFFYTIPESTEIGSTVGILSAVDEDNGLDGQFVFTVQGGNGSDYVILTSSGQLYTTGHFDYDTTPPLYELIVIVSDTPWNRSSSLTSTATVIIEIEDVNDNPPIFSRFVYHTQIMENASLHEHILTVECHDIDSGINAIPVYSVTKQSHDHFYINASTGDIFLQSSLDYEMNTIHQVTVSCTDSQKSAYSSESLVVIQVLSVNEYQCTFNQSQYMFQVPEDASIGAIIGYVNATDEDKGTAGELTFEISPSSCSDIITVDDSSSAVILISEVDYEESSYIACSVSVYDKQAPITSNKANITLQILNVNDNPPVCEPVLPINIYSNITTGTTIGNLTCTDKDSNDLSFFLMESVLQDSIAIVSNGEVVLVHPINYDINITSVWITAIVTDGYHYDDIKMLLFIFLSLPVSNPDTYHASISEDASIGMIVTQVHCTSTLNDTVIHYTLSSNGKFQINVETGVIITISNLDYETAVLHQLTGACYYSNNPILYTELSLFITILPVNDNSPYFSETNVTIKVEEDAQPGSLLGALVAHDLDHGDDGRLKYFIDDSTKHFAINANTGDLYLINILDREREDQYSLLITVTDSPGNISETKSDSMTIRVQVQDINDNHPQCSHDRYRTSISTSTRVGTPLVSLDCHDVDSMENGTLSFLIHENVSLFLLNSSSGELFLSEPITPATSPFHTIPILIKDHGVESQETLVYAVIELENTVTVAASPSDEEITVEGIRNAVTFTIDNIRETEVSIIMIDVCKLLFFVCSGTMSFRKY